MVVRLRAWLSAWAVKRRQRRYERLRRKLKAARDRVLRDLEAENRELRVALQEAQIDIRMLKRTVEQQEYVINRDRHRVLREIKELGGRLLDSSNDQSA